MSTAWVLVADHAKARLFEFADEDHSFNEIEDFIHAQGRGRELARDRPPRTHDSMGPGRHAIEPRTSAREKGAQAFARELDNALESGRTAHRYDDLVLVAPASFLGELKAGLDEPLRQCVVAEVPKELTNIDVQALRGHLPDRFHAPSPSPPEPSRRPRVQR